MAKHSYEEAVKRFGAADAGGSGDSGDDISSETGRQAISDGGSAEQSGASSGTPQMSGLAAYAQSGINATGPVKSMINRFIANRINGKDVDQADRDYGRWQTEDKTMGELGGKQHPLAASAGGLVGAGATMAGLAAAMAPAGMSAAAPLVYGTLMRADAALLQDPAHRVSEDDLSYIAGMPQMRTAYGQASRGHLLSAGKAMLNTPVADVVVPFTAGKVIGGLVKAPGAISGLIARKSENVFRKSAGELLDTVDKGSQVAGGATAEDLEESGVVGGPSNRRNAGANAKNAYDQANAVNNQVHNPNPNFKTVPLERADQAENVINGMDGEYPPGVVDYDRAGEVMGRVAKEQADVAEPAVAGPGAGGLDGNNTAAASPKSGSRQSGRGPVVDGPYEPKLRETPPASPVDDVPHEQFGPELGRIKENLSELDRASEMKELVRRYSVARTFGKVPEPSIGGLAGSMAKSAASGAAASTAVAGPFGYLFGPKGAAVSFATGATTGAVKGAYNYGSQNMVKAYIANKLMDSAGRASQTLDAAGNAIGEFAGINGQQALRAAKIISSGAAGTAMDPRRP